MLEPLTNYAAPSCRGCGAYLTMDDMQDGHTCRVSSNDLTPTQIAFAQAGWIGDRWEVTPDGLGFVHFEDPLEARNVLQSPTRRPA